MGKGQPSTPTHMTSERETIGQVYERLRPRVGGKAVTESNMKALGSKMAAVSITDTQAARGSSGSGASASISIGSVVLKGDQIEEFETSIAFAQAVLETVNLGDSEDLDEAREMLTELSNKKDALSNFKTKNPHFERYQVVSFSKLTKKHLADMGVTSMDLSQNHLDRVLQAFNTITPVFVSQKTGMRNKEALPAIFEPFWKKLVKDGRYIDDFKILKKNIGRKPEARARMLTDYILTQLMVFVEKHLEVIQFMFLELVLSSSGDPIPIKDKGNKTATLLTGTVDYAILSSFDPKKDIADSLGVGLDKVEDETKKLSDGNSLDDIVGNKIWPFLQKAQHFKFTIIEEKRKDLDGKKLRDCQPQVIGEALALGGKTRQMQVLWCLSNGEDWIFGVVNNKESRILPHMSINDNDLEGSIKTILKMLILWTVCPLAGIDGLLDTQAITN